jgi:hypothetical protein
MFNFHSTFLNRKLNDDEEVFRNNHLAMKNLDQRNIVSSSTSQSMELNRLEIKGMRLFAAHSQTWDLRSARPTQLFSTLSPEKTF